MQSQLLTTLGERPLENTVGKEQNAGNQHLFLFPQYFLHFLEQISNFQSHSFCQLQMLSIMDQSKILSFGKGLNHLVVKD